MRYGFPRHWEAPDDRRGVNPPPPANAGGGGGGGSVTPEPIGGGDQPNFTITGLKDAGPDVRGRQLAYRLTGGGGGALPNTAPAARQPDLGGPWGETGPAESPNLPREPDRGSGRFNP